MALRLTGEAHEIAWVGDSRAYVYDGDLRQLTPDDSAVSEVLARGVIDMKRAASHAQRHALIKAALASGGRDNLWTQIPPWH